MRINYLGRLTKNNQLIEFSNNEINGYQSQYSVVPEYRKTIGSLIVVFQAYMNKYSVKTPVFMLDSSLNEILRYEDAHQLGRREKQMQYFNPPKVTPDVFERLLPYAIALKTEVWGDKFEKTLLQSMQSVDSYAPIWYYGTAMRPRSFSNNLRQSLTSNIQQSATSPKSSGNWSSGSFGGGSVGGGGGGGRSGGW